MGVIDLRNEFRARLGVVTVIGFEALEGTRVFLDLMRCGSIFASVYFI